MKVENEKCGEIFRHGPGLFTFSCAYCSEYFDSKEDALNHIENHFLLEPGQICMDQINLESCELPSILLNDIQETIEINENNIESFSEIIIVEPLKIEIQDSFFNNSTGDDNIKYDSKSETEIEAPTLSKTIEHENEEEKEADKAEKKWIFNRKKIVKCDVCGKEMQNSSLLRHLKKTHGKYEKPTVQRSSEKERKVSESEETQMDITASENVDPSLKTWVLNRKKIIKCNLCGKEMQNSSLLRHLKKTHGKYEKSTEQCSSEKEQNVSFESKETQMDITASKNVDPTLKAWILNRNKIIKCDLCGKEMLNQSLLRHMKIHKKCENTLRSTKKWHLNRKKIKKCHICGKRLQQQSIRRHLKTHFEISDLTADSSINLNSKIVKKFENTECSVCGKMLKRFELSEHIASHRTYIRSTDHIIKWQWGPPTRKMLVECDICGKKMTKRSILFHLQSHANLKEYICSVCKKGFNSDYQLMNHMKIHFQYKKFSCHFCGRQFYQHSNLRVHIRIHTGEKRYQCFVCDRRFTQSYPLTLHMRTHTGEKPYTCDICGLKFSNNSMCANHKVRHLDIKPYKCDVCGNFLKTQQSLQEHRRIHTGERPYTCEICNLTFARRFTYKQHLVLHTGTKPYKCRFCDKKFAQCAARRCHERSTHKDPKQENHYIFA